MREVGRIVRSSHERWDGAGYPDGLVGEAIPLEARICSVCDAYNAMTTTRSYRKAMPVSEAVAELTRCAGTQFDPRVVDALLAVVASDEAAEPAEPAEPSGPGARAAEGTPDSAGQAQRAAVAAEPRSSVPGVLLPTG
jgi:HD-GYP domain-containing protein (c-di-GMP phosphodiesterase class II)